MPLDTHYSSYSTASLGRYNRDSNTRWRTISSTASSGVGSSNLFISSRAVSGVDLDNIYGFTRSSPLSLDLPYESSVSASHSNSKYVSRSSPVSYARECRTGQDHPSAKHRRQATSTSKRIFPDRNTTPSHRFHLTDSAHHMSGAESVRTQFNEDRSYYPCSRKSKAFTRSLTTDLGTDISSINSSYSYHRNVASHLGHETTFHRNYRPIFIERPSITSLVPRASEVRSNFPTRPVRRDRPLVKFLEREDLNPDKVRNLLNAWARGRHAGEPDEDEAENRKRDSVRSDDSGIGSFRNSRRSRQKSGEFIHEISIKCDDGGNYLPKGVEEGTKVVNSAAADEGVHLETEEPYQALLPGKELREIGKSSAYTSKKSDESAVEKTDLNTKEQTLQKSDSPQNVSQNKRRVRINANENTICSETKLESADENNNKLSSQNLNNGETFVGSTPADTKILKCSIISSENVLNKEEKTDVEKIETILVNDTMAPEALEFSADKTSSFTDDFEKRRESKGEAINTESIIKCVKDKSTDLKTCERKENKTDFTELSKSSQSAQTVIAKQPVCECTESKQQKKEELNAVTSSILLNKTSSKIEQECSQKSLDIKNKKKVKNLDAERKKIKPEVIKDGINKSINDSTALAIGPRNEKVPFSLSSEASKREKDSTLKHESGTLHETQKVLLKTSVVEEKSKFEPKVKIVKNADILTQEAKPTTYTPENKINLKEKELMSAGKKESSEIKGFNSDTKLEKKRKVDTAEKPGLKQKNEALTTTENQKLVFPEVENKTGGSNLNNEAPIAKQVSNSFVGESISKTCTPEKTGIQPSSEATKKKRLPDTYKQAQKFTYCHGTNNVQKSESDDFTIHANRSESKASVAPRKSSFAEYTSVTKELIKNDTVVKSSETKDATKETTYKYDNIKHVSNVRRSTIGEYPTCNSIKTLYQLQKSFSTDSKNIMKEVSTSHVSQHWENFLTSKLNKMRTSSITEGKSESVKSIPAENYSSLGEVSNSVSQNICSDETPTPVSVSNIIDGSKETCKIVAEDYKLKSPADSLTFKSDNKTISEKCKKTKQVTLLSLDNITKDKRNLETQLTSENFELSKIPSDKGELEKNTQSEKLSISLNKMKTEGNRTTASNTKDVKKTFAKFEKDFQSCKNNIQDVVTAAAAVNNTKSIQTLQENVDSSLKNNSSAKHIQTDTLSSFSETKTTNEKTQKRTKDVSDKPESLSPKSKLSKDAQLTDTKIETDVVKMAPQLTKCGKKIFKNTKLPSDTGEQASVILQSKENNNTQIIIPNERTQEGIAIVPNKPNYLSTACKITNGTQVTGLKSEIDTAEMTSQFTKCENKNFREKELTSRTEKDISAADQEAENYHSQFISTSDTTQEMALVSNKSKVSNATRNIVNEVQLLNHKPKIVIDKMAPSQLPKIGKKFAARNELSSRVAERVAVTPQATNNHSEVSDRQANDLSKTCVKTIRDVPHTSDSTAVNKHKKDVNKNKTPCVPEAITCSGKPVENDPGIPEEKKVPNDEQICENNFFAKQEDILSPLEQQENLTPHSTKTIKNHDNIKLSNVSKQGAEIKIAGSCANTKSALQEDICSLKSDLTDKGVIDNNELRAVFNNEEENCYSKQPTSLKTQEQIIKTSDKVLNTVQSVCVETKISEDSIENKKVGVTFNKKEGVASNEEETDSLLQNKASHSSDDACIKPDSAAHDNKKENEPKSNVSTVVLLQEEAVKAPSRIKEQDKELQNTADKPPVKKKKVKTENENETPKKKKKKRKISKQSSVEGKKQHGPKDDIAISVDLADNKTPNTRIIEETGKDRIEESAAGINSTACTGGEVKQVTHPVESTENSEVQKVSLDDLWIEYCDLTEECTKALIKEYETPDVLHPVSITIEDFSLLKVLGRGSYGKVMLAELKGRRQYFAIKCLKKHIVQEDNDVECTMIEREVLAMGSNHPYLCTLFCTFQNESHLFFVMEYLSGGDLMFHIQQSGRFDEDRARFYAAEIVCALKYLHKHGIIYRDAKLDNICIDADGHVRLVDFGFCKLKIYRKECLPRNLCGTPDYMAPEIIKGQHYNQSVDWWSFGVLLYEMLTGQSPFNGGDEEELFWSVCNEDIFYPRYITKEAKELLALLLNKNPEKRLGMPGCDAGDIYGQSFFNFIDWVKVERKEMEPPFKPKLKSETDVSNFDSDFTMEKAVLTPTESEILVTVDQEQFAGFSYTNSSMFPWAY